MNTPKTKKPIPTDGSEVRDTILSNLQTIHGDDRIIEVRMLKTSQGTINGFFNDREKLVDEVLRYNGKCNIFSPLNPLKDSVPVTNTLQPYTKRAVTDADIARRQWLFIDIDPERPSDTSATSGEQEYALSMATEVMAFLSDNGFPAPVFAESGNGFHLLYRVDMSNDRESNNLIKTFLNVLADKFSNDKADIDKGVSNAARLSKLYGTMAVKGKATPERPHRRSNIVDIPSALEIVTAEQIRAVTDLLMPSQAQRTAVTAKTEGADSGKKGKKFDVEAFMSDNGIEVVAAEKEASDYRLWRIVCVLVNFNIK